MTVNSDRSARAAGAGPAPRRLAAGAGCGLLATIGMSAVMLIGMATGLAPMPEPIPVALVTRALGELAMPALVVLGMAAHLGYGGVAGAVLAGLISRVTWWIGLSYGVLLWLIMNLAWFPYLGWGLFGMSLTPRVAVATLLLHLLYGALLGLLLDRPRAVRRVLAEHGRSSADG